MFRVNYTEKVWVRLKVRHYLIQVYTYPEDDRLVGHLHDVGCDDTTIIGELSGNRVVEVNLGRNAVTQV